MVNFKKTFSGIGVFCLGYIFCGMSQYFLPPIVDFLGDTIGGIVWLGMILLWFSALILIPLAISIAGIIEDSAVENKVILAVVALFYFIFAAAICYFSWYAVSPLAEIFTETFLIGSFYVGLILMWLLHIIVIPTYMIIESKKG